MWCLVSMYLLLRLPCLSAARFILLHLFYYDHGGAIIRTWHHQVLNFSERENILEDFRLRYVLCLSRTYDHSPLSLHVCMRLPWFRVFGSALSVILRFCVRPRHYSIYTIVINLIPLPKGQAMLFPMKISRAKLFTTTEQCLPERATN